MHIQEDLDYMFSGETMPLGHRRKIETAVKNMKSAIDTGSHEHHLPIVEQKVQNVEMKPSLLKMKEEISKLEAKLELALSRKRDMDKFVPMPEQDGPFKNQTCSVCHIWGHRADGNRDRSHCDKEPCSSWTFGGRKEKHKPEVIRAKKDIKKEIRELNLIISDMRTEINKMDVFEQRTQTSFMHIMKPRLKSLDSVKYSMSTNLLMRDLIIHSEGIVRVKFLSMTRCMTRLSCQKRWNQWLMLREKHPFKFQNASTTQKYPVRKCALTV